MKAPSKEQNEKLSAQAKKATERAAKLKPPTSSELEETVALIRQLHRNGLTPKAKSFAHDLIGFDSRFFDHQQI